MTQAEARRSSHGETTTANVATKPARTRPARAQRFCQSGQKIKNGATRQELTLEHSADGKQAAAPKPSSREGGKRCKQIERQDPDVPLWPGMGIEDERRLEPCHARGEQTANPSAFGCGQTIQPTRVGRTGRPAHSQSDEQENPNGRDQLADRVNDKERLDVVGRPIFRARIFCSHLSGPERHDEEPERRIIEVVILFVGIGLDVVVEAEVAAHENWTMNPIWPAAKGGGLPPAFACPNRSHSRCRAESAGGWSSLQVSWRRAIPPRKMTRTVRPKRICRVRSGPKNLAGKRCRSIRGRASAHRVAAANKDRGCEVRQALASTSSKMQRKRRMSKGLVR